MSIRTVRTEALNTHLNVDQEVVALCHDAALKVGAKSNGPPGSRTQYSPTYYAAFVPDPVGNNIEFVHGR